MRNSFRIVLFTLGMFPLMSTLAFGLPGLVNYKGLLTDPLDNPVAGPVDVTFTLWDAETGGPTEVIDQQQTNFDTQQTETIAQSFTAQDTGTLTKIRIQAWDYYAGGSNTVTIIDGGDPNGATILATQIFSMSGGSPQWNDIIFDSPASVVAGQQYCFVFYCCSNGMQINRASDNPYAGGKAFHYDAMDSEFMHISGGNGDYVFETFVTSGGGNQLGAGFSDTDSVTPNADGIYDTLIGDEGGPMIPDTVFKNDSVWLNVNVGGEDLAPRTRLTPVGAALHAGSAGDADTVDGLEGSDLEESADIATNAAAIAAIDTSGIADNATSISALIALIGDLQTQIGDLQQTQQHAHIWEKRGGDIDGEAAGDNSGNSVSLSSDGSIVAIGATGNDGNGNASGHVRVYEYINGSWTQRGTDIDGEAAVDLSGKSVSLSSDGSIVAIGGYGNDDNGSSSGHVRVYQYDSGSWTQLGADIDGEAAGDNSGFSVSLSSDGSVVAIGAPKNDGNGGFSGHVRVHAYMNGSWTQRGGDIDGEAGGTYSGDYSGWSVSLSSDGSIVAIGARWNDGNGGQSGHVRVYAFNGSSWTPLGADIDGEAAEDYSGYSVSLNSDGIIVAIGAYYNDGNGSDNGHVRVYAFNGSSWTQLGSDIDGEAAEDKSGGAVSLSSDGSIVAIGARGNDGNGNASGHVRVYRYINNSWQQVNEDIDGEAAEDQSGGAVSLSGDGSIVAIGADGNDSGHVRVYKNQ
jgi:hypothetical protein